MRDFTPEELATVRRMCAEGKSQADTRRAIKIAPHNFYDNVRQLGLEFAPSTAVSGTPRRQFTGAELALVKREAAAGAPKRDVVKKLVIGWSQFDRLVKEHGIEFKEDTPKPQKDRPAVKRDDGPRAATGVPTLYPLKKSRREMAIRFPADVMAWLEETARVAGRPVESIVIGMVQEIVIDTVNSEAMS